MNLSSSNKKVIFTRFRLEIRDYEDPSQDIWERAQRENEAAIPRPNPKKRSPAEPRVLVLNSKTKE